MTAMGMNKNFSVAFIVSLGFHLGILFGAIPDFSSQAGQKGEEKLIVSFGAIELPAIITREPILEPPPPEEPLSPSDKDSIAAETSPEEPKEKFQPELKPDNSTLGTPELTVGQIESIKTRFLREVIAKIHKVKRYPESARRMDLEGIAKVEFILSGRGKIFSVSIIISSGYTILDKEAVAVIERAAPFPQIPEELEISELKLLLPIVFRLEK